MLLLSMMIQNKEYYIPKLPMKGPLGMAWKELSILMGALLTVTIPNSTPHPTHHKSFMSYYLTLMRSLGDVFKSDWAVLED